MIESHGRELPVSGSPVNVRVHMEPSPGSFAPGECQPIEFCSVDSRTDIPTWIFPTLTSPIEITFLTSAAAEHTVRLYEDSDGVGCTGCGPAPETTAASAVAGSASASAPTASEIGTTAKEIGASAREIRTTASEIDARANEPACVAGR